MPELPEAEFCREQLERWTVGRPVQALAVLAPKSLQTGLRKGPALAGTEAWALWERLKGQTSVQVLRRGKRIGWRVGDVGLIVHLGMTGRLTRSDVAVPHARIGWQVDDHWIWFEDPRRFGAVIPVPGEALLQRLSEGLGPDAWTGDVADAVRGAKGRTKLKAWLMDQKRIAGLGNIQVCETMWKACLHPDRTVGSLGEDERQALVDGIHWTLARSLRELEGLDEMLYLSSRESTPADFHVYGHAGEACRRCGETLVRENRAGRGTFWCPACQPTPG